MNPTAAAITILLADDNEPNRYLIRKILEGAGYRVKEAATAAETQCLAYDVEFAPSLMILDVHLPDGSGYDLCRLFKADPLLAHIPILQMSAVFTKNVDQVHGLNCGANTYLVQPIDSGVLLATVRALLRVGQAEEARAEELRREREARELAESDCQKLRAAFLQSPVATWILRGPSHVVEFANPSAIALMGASAVIGSQIHVVWSDFGAHEDHLERAFTRGEPSTSRERIFPGNALAGADEGRKFNFDYQPWRDALGVITGTLVFAVEVSDQGSTPRPTDGFITPSPRAENLPSPIVT